MKAFLFLIAAIAMLSVSGCELHEGHRGGGYDHHWSGYGHGERMHHENY